MTGGWGKSAAAIFIGAAAIGTAERTADAQVASVGVSGTQQTTAVGGTGVQTTTTGTAQAQAQQAQTPAFRVDGTIRSSLEINDNGGLRQNPPGNDTTFRTNLGLDVISETPTQQLSLSFSADLQYEDQAVGREENGVENPTLRFRYNMDGADSSFTVTGRYRTDDIFDSFFFDSDGDLIEDTLLESDGDRTDQDISLSYSFGLQAPFGMDFTLSRRERDYSNTVNPNLFDSQTDSVGVTGRFRISPVVTARAFLNESYYEAEDGGGTERDTTDYGVGVQYQIRPDLSFDGQISATDIEETQTFGTNSLVTNNDGVSAALSLTRTLTNGSLTVSGSRTQSLSTARSEVRVDRSLTTPGGGLSFGVGISNSDTGDTGLIASLDYTNQLATGFLTANLSRTTSVNQDNDEVTRTVAGLSYNHPINQVSSWNFGLSVADVASAGVGTVSEGTRADVRLGYSRQLTEDWDWTIGYVNRYRSSAGGADARSNSIVTSIGRSFSIRP